MGRAEWFYESILKKQTAFSDLETLRLRVTRATSVHFPEVGCTVNRRRLLPRMLMVSLRSLEC